MDGRRTVLWLAALGALAAGCGGDPQVKIEPGTMLSVEFQKRLVAAEPAGAKSVTDVKSSAKEGDEVVVRGEVGGSAKPIVEGRAVFNLADPEKLTSCNKKPGDTCATPWDYCCHTPEEIAASTISLQVRGADGRPIATDLGASGIRPLTALVVKGKVGPRPDPKVLVIDATEIWVAK